MTSDDGPNIKDVILKEYELTDAYHDQKAHSAWIASTVYFAFSIGFFSFWKEPGCIVTSIFATFLCFVVFSCAMSFISLQFKHRWDSVIRTGMYHWLFDNKWRKIGDYNNYRKFKNCFDELEDKNQKLGITKERKVFDILWMTILLPVILPANFFFMMNAKKKLADIEEQIKEIKYERTQNASPVTDREKLLYRQKRRRKAGLIDTKYRTEIPAYSISFYFFIAQLLLVWFPKLFGRL